MTPILHPSALRELADAIIASDAIAAGLGNKLLDEIARIVSLLCEAPGIGRPLDGGRRQFPVGRFPYVLIYRTDGSRLRVIALAHRRRNPRYWAHRI